METRVTISQMQILQLAKKKENNDKLENIKGHLNNLYIFYGIYN